MSKHYLPLISLLSVIALAVGSFAFYKSITTPPESPDLAAIISLPPTQTPTPPGTVAGIATASEGAKPQLHITSPQAEASVSSSLLTVSGKTATAAAIIINDTEAEADDLGNFSAAIRLVPGPNLVVITASSAGQSSIWQTVVTYTPRIIEATPAPTQSSAQ